MNNRSNTIVKLFSISAFFITSLINAQHMLVSEITPRLSTTSMMNGGTMPANLKIQKHTPSATFGLHYQRSITSEILPSYKAKLGIGLLYYIDNYKSIFQFDYSPNQKQQKESVFKRQYSRATPTITVGLSRINSPYEFNARIAYDYMDFFHTETTFETQYGNVLGGYDTLIMVINSLDNSSTKWHFQLEFARQLFNNERNVGANVGVVLYLNGISVKNDNLITWNGNLYKFTSHYKSCGIGLNLKFKFKYK
mgnify:FL=1|jgi:hypothetical protein